jgi:FlaA1/EpsC-like NDP-sugar epimerase
MKEKVLITGGTGTVGTAFIKKYHDIYKFFTVSRGEKNIARLKEKYPDVECILGNINNLSQLINTFETVKPDIVIHAAAIKHVNLAELNPTQTVESNVIGSLNVIKASIRAEVPLTVGISTDKACSPENIYGYSKKMMEKLFLEHNNEKTKFVCTRFANVADCEGSVIPLWLNWNKQDKPLKLTDPCMNRLMFSTDDASELIHKAIDLSSKYDNPFILSKKMRTVNMLRLAESISSNIEIIGKRPGEKLDENLINEKELPYTHLLDDWIILFNTIQPKSVNLKKELSSQTATKMNNQDINKLLKWK